MTRTRRARSERRTVYSIVGAAIARARVGSAAAYPGLTMAVKRERPTHTVPGELHTPDGRVARVKLPPELQPPTGVHPETVAQEVHPEPDDPRPSLMRNVPPYGAA